MDLNELPREGTVSPKLQTGEHPTEEGKPNNMQADVRPLSDSHEAPGVGAPAQASEGAVGQDQNGFEQARHTAEDGDMEAHTEENHAAEEGGPLDSEKKDGSTATPASKHDDLEEEPPDPAALEEVVTYDRRVLRPRRAAAAAKRVLESTKPPQQQPKRSRREISKGDKGDTVPAEGQDAEPRDTDSTPTLVLPEHVDDAGNPDGRAQSGLEQAEEPVQAEASSQDDEEDVCFVCYNGGTIYKCDEGGCPKWYHAECIGREDDFFNQPGTWCCGWHFCSKCGKASKYRCLTSMQSYCKSCIKDVEFLKLKENAGLCETCVPLVNVIENGVPGEMDDMDSAEGLFKAYWNTNKAKWGVSLPKLGEDGKAIEIEEHSEENGGPATRSRKKRAVIELDDETDEEQDEGNDKAEEEAQYESWASPQLLDFLKMMGRDVSKRMLRFAVNKAIWEYIKEHNLQNPRKKSQIICDDVLKGLFHRKELGQFEMQKMLNEHFPKSKAAAKARGGQRVLPDAAEGNMDVDNMASPRDRPKLTRSGSSRKRGRRSPSPEPAAPSDFAAVSEHNIKLLYLKRGLLESLLGMENLDQLVAGALVRIRVDSQEIKQMYRLVLIRGVTEGTEYTVGKKKTKKILQIQNLSRQEEVMVDQLSNQDFTSDDLKRLRRAIKKAGVYKPWTVGDLEAKAKDLHPAKVKEEMEAEKQKLANLRDRASEMGKKKELRECVEKLAELEKPNTLSAKLDAPLKVEVDPNMDPAVEEEDSEEENGDKDKERKGHDAGTPRGQEPRPSRPSSGPSRKDSWRQASDPSPRTERARPVSRDTRSRERTHQIGRRNSPPRPPLTSPRSNPPPRRVSEPMPSSRSRPHNSKPRPYSPPMDRGVKPRGYSPPTRTYTPPRDRKPRAYSPPRDMKPRAYSPPRDAKPRAYSPPRDAKPRAHSPPRDMKPRAYSPPRDSRARPYSPPSDTKARAYSPPRRPNPPPRYREAAYEEAPRPRAPSPGRPMTRGGLVEPTRKEGPPPLDIPPGMPAPTEVGPIWFYRDPSNNVQGPFSVEQLRKWHATGVFTPDFTVWRMGEREGQGVLLTDVLAGRTGGWAPPPYPSPRAHPSGPRYDSGPTYVSPREISDAAGRSYPIRGPGSSFAAFQDIDEPRRGYASPKPVGQGSYSAPPRNGVPRGPPPLREQGPEGGRGSGKRACKYFDGGKGFCRKGKDCDFVHVRL